MTPRLRYRFDQFMSRGPRSVMLGLFLVSAAFVLLFAVVMIAFGITGDSPDGGAPGLPQLLWTNTLHLIDPGNIGDDEGALPFMVLMFLMSLVGIIIFSTLIGALNQSLQDTFERLRKGRSKVVESGHTVILGWSQQIFTILAELQTAHAGGDPLCIAILADRDKVEMEAEIHDRLSQIQLTSNGEGDDVNTPGLRRTHRQAARGMYQKPVRIVCRSGNPVDLGDLQIVNPSEAKSIILLPPDATESEADAATIRSILAICNRERIHGRMRMVSRALNSAPQGGGGPVIIAEIFEAESREIARLAANGSPDVLIMEIDSIITRLMAQTCRQSGLSLVYNELLDFEGCEIYMQPLEGALTGLIGRRLGDVLLLFEEAAIIGVKSAGIPARIGITSDPASGDPGPHASLSLDHVLHADDRLIAIMENARSMQPTSAGDAVDAAHIATAEERVELPPEHAYILGWNHQVPGVIEELSRYVPEGSHIHLVAGDPAAAALGLDAPRRWNAATVSHTQADPLEWVRRLTPDVASFRSVILPSPFDAMDAESADAWTLNMLLRLRHFQTRHGRSFSIVSEMLDDNNRKLLEVTSGDDIIVSNKLHSLLLAQLSENRDLYDVFEDLFDEEGSEIYLKPASLYVTTPVEATFATVVEAARRRHELAIGWKIMHNGSYAVRINPGKRERTMLRPEDAIIVIAEGEA